MINLPLPPALSLPAPRRRHPLAPGRRSPCLPRRFRPLLPAPMKVNPLVALLKLDVVIAATGQPADRIYEKVDTGEWRWVFNLATNARGGTRDLRFWSREIAGYDVRKLKLKTVLDEILGGRTLFQSGEVCLLFSIRRPTLRALHAQLGGGPKQPDPAYTRNGLHTFLNQRLTT